MQGRGEWDVPLERRWWQLEPLLEDATVFSLAFTDSEFYCSEWGPPTLYSEKLSELTFLQYPDSTGWILSLAARKDTLFVGTEEGGLFRTLHKSPGWWSPSRLDSGTLL